jgi:energy-coupling factor transporter ATP-binding protein EcfA2
MNHAVQQLSLLRVVLSLAGFILIFIPSIQGWTAPLPMPTRPHLLLRPPWNGFSCQNPLFDNLCMRLKRDFTDDDYDEEEDDDEPPEIGDLSTFRMADPTSTPLSFGYNKGRSSPTTRKALGKSGTSIASVYLCTHCGSEYVQWMGRCPTCREWNTIQQHVVSRSSTDSARSPRPSFGGSLSPHQRPPGSWLDDISYTNKDGTVGAIGNVPIRITDLTASSKEDETNGSHTPRHRRIVIPDDDEFNMVLGGGIMKGSLVLLGGDPGVGKSTLLLQVAGSIAARLSCPTPKIGMGPLPASNDSMGPVWYVSGEENPDQIASRAIRLGILEDSSELFLLRQTHVDTLCEQVVSHGMNHDTINDENDMPPQLPISLLVIDSIQTMVCDAGGTSYAGGITQVRECVAMFLRLAKSTNIPVLLIGHVTKSGEVAGPRTVEHSTYRIHVFRIVTQCLTFI